MRSKEFRKLVGDLARAGEPTDPRCPHAKECGGCAFQDRDYSAQVAAKAQAMGRLFAEANLAEVGYQADTFTVLPSPAPYAYRTRMDYVATKGRFGLRQRGKFNYIVELTTCHLIPPAAFAAAQAVWLRANELGLPDYNIRSHEGFLRYVVVRRSPDDALLLAAVTAAGPYEAEMERLAEAALAQPGVVSFHWLLNDSLTDLSFGSPLRHWGEATLAMRAGEATLEVGPNTFFQNNVHLLGQLLDDVLAAVVSGEQKRSSVADLYGGVGTIALHLSPHVGEVVCVESVGESAELAARNSAANGVSNVRAVAMDVLAYLREQPAGACEVAVADPPRTGLGPDVCAELLRVAPGRIVYVSCNPLTLAEDLRALGAGYRLRSLTGYDMFPHTPHVEAMAVLDRQ
ncbi:23S rRNA (uracil(1939)-C(5))-methyltransferase RlmD [Chloroflexales bacterium ZM16-3]|nr:23S rRNA (uracil(1939)-C(5))-methyltransferase RlmD [Chloroflexales bacterium ZM16-3]